MEGGNNNLETDKILSKLAYETVATKSEKGLTICFKFLYLWGSYITWICCRQV